MPGDDGQFEEKIGEILSRARRHLENIEIKTVPVESPAETATKQSVEEAQAINNQNYEEIEQARKNAEVQSIVENNEDMKANRLLRWKYATWVYCYLVAYSLCVLFILLWCGAKTVEFELPESVLGFLVGSTAVSAIGLVYAVTHGLFGNHISK